MQKRRIIQLRKGNVVAIVVLLVFTLFFVASSPLSKGNVWVDTNAMLEVGRAWVHGRVPYEDVFEQRGPLMFFYYFIVNFISSNGFLGLYVIELLNLVIIYAISRKVFASVFPKSRVNFDVMAIIIPILMVLDKSFETGGSPEEFAVTWSLIGIYMVIEVVVGSATSSWRTGFIFGAAVAAVFWIKFTLVGLLIGASIFVLVYLLAEKRFLYLTQMIIAALSVFFISGIIVAAYFKIVNALNDFIQTYFLMNINAYGGNASLHDRLNAFYQSVNNIIMGNGWIFSIWLLSILVLFAVSKRIAALMLSVGIFGVVVTYAVGQARVYSFVQVYAVMVLTILLAVFVFADKFSNAHIWWFSLIAIFPVVANPFIGKLSYVWQSNTPAAQTFATKIRQYEGNKRASLMYYNIIDAGVERYIDISVAEKFKYFEKTNVPDELYPEQGISLRKSVLNGTPDYVVVGLNWGWQPAIDLDDKNKVEEHIPAELRHHYRLVQAAYSFYPIETDQNQFQMALLKRK